MESAWTRAKFETWSGIALSSAVASPGNAFAFTVALEGVAVGTATGFAGVRTAQPGQPNAETSASTNSITNTATTMRT